jgi:hypothetical protein
MRSELCDLLSDAAEQQPQPGQELLQQQLQAADSQAGLLQQQQQLELPDCGVEHMHYCETSRLLAVVFADGSAALYSPGHAGALPTAQLDFRRWLCGPAARWAGQRPWRCLCTAECVVVLIGKCTLDSSSVQTSSAGHAVKGCGLWLQPWL